MTPEEFRHAGHALIDWIADYRADLEQRPVRAQVKPGEIRANFPQQAPEDAAGAAQLLRDLEHKIVPGITQVQHPMHFGWFPSNASLASALGDIASAGLGTLGISWESCPAATELEEVVCDWLRQLTGLSDAWQGCIQDTASTSCLTSLLLARERASDFSQNRGGLQGEQQALIVYTTDEAHSSVVKAALLAGFGEHNLRRVEMDPHTRSMSASSLAQLVASDLAAGHIPAAVVASTGSTGVTAFDPVADIATITAQHGIWLHVDAAMAGSAMLLPECRHLWDGVEAADSVAWNPHKWMGTILDSRPQTLVSPRHRRHRIDPRAAAPRSRQRTLVCRPGSGSPGLVRTRTGGPANRLHPSPACRTRRRVARPSHPRLGRRYQPVRCRFHEPFDTGRPLDGAGLDRG